MLYNIRLQKYKSTDFDSVDLPGCNLSSCGRGTRKLISLEKILRSAKTESFVSDCEPAVSSVFRQKLMDGPAHLHCGFMELWKTVKHAWNPEEMDNHSEEERNISTEDILKTLDRFGSKTPSPVEDVGRLIAMESVARNGKVFYVSLYVSTAGKNRLRISTVSKMSVGLVKYPLLNKPISLILASLTYVRTSHDYKKVLN